MKTNRLREEKQVLSVDDFDKKYFPQYFQSRQREQDYRESELSKEPEFLIRLFSGI
jgi:hypothetical protein